MKATARCPHRVIWYRFCHWCETEANEAYYKADFADRHCFTFWRRSLPHTAVEEMKIAAVRDLMRRAISAWE